MQKNYKDRIKDNYELYDEELVPNYLEIRQVISGIKKKKIIVPRIQRGIVWGRKKIKELVISLFKKIPIDKIIMWELSSKNENAKQFRTIIKNEEPVPDDVNFLLDGLQRCSAICAVFSNDMIAIDEKFQDIDLYYNIFEDVFMFKEEIKELDDTWINLKDTYDPDESESNKPKDFMKRYKPILADLEVEDNIKIRNRIERIFGLVKKKLEISSYTGTNINLAFDLLIFSNYGSQYSVLDLLYSILSNFSPKTRKLIEDFSETTKQKLKRHYLKIHDILHLIIHLMNPGYYSKRKINVSRIDPSSINLEKIVKTVNTIAKKSNFLHFLEILNKAIISFLPLDKVEEEIHNIFIINEFRTKSALYSSYCLYLYCLKEREKEEFHQFLGRYFFYNILFERFNKRETDVMMDLRIINENSQDYNAFNKKITDELDEVFWTLILPQKLLDQKSHQSDTSFLYQLALIPNFVFNSTIIKMKNVLVTNIKQKNNQVESLPIRWIRIFPRELIRKYGEVIHYNSILNYILIDHTGKSKQKLARNRKPWGWLKEILTSMEGIEGIESTWVDGYFEAWDFPRNYDKEIKLAQNSFNKKKHQDYFSEFFENRAKKMAKRIQKTFFP
ncbi:MAG: GmrSD restriction endonuclease domain-containing protein [Promethearchaeota archaeon]|jgi:hypothetical protein